LKVEEIERSVLPKIGCEYVSLTLSFPPAFRLVDELLSTYVVGGGVITVVPPPPLLPPPPPGTTVPS